MSDIRDIMDKYSRQLGNEIQSDSQTFDIGDVSADYDQFKKDMAPELSRYEKLCQTLGGIIKIKVAQKDEEKIQNYLDAAHLDVTPSQSLTLAIVSLFGSMLVGILVVILVWIWNDMASFPGLLLFLVLIFSLFLFYYVYSKPSRLANQWRLKSASQMVPAVLYMVAYMKHTSNLERAIAFAAKHLDPPLALDFKKIFWDVETGRFPTVRDSLDSYLETWRNHSPEFIESFHLIESSLFEPSESRRIHILEKALQVILDGVYEKMLKYSHEIRSPLTNIYMLGIVLPTLGLALLPLASTLLQGMIQWYHVFVFFNLIIPFFVFYMTSEVMLKRPGGHGETNILEKSPLYYKFASKKPYLIAFLICLPFLILGSLPFIFQYTPVPQWLGLQKDYTFQELGLGLFGDANFFDFKDVNGNLVGPFGLGALVLSLFIPFALALFFSISYLMRTKEIIKSRDYSKQLEEEFASSLFQLGNRIGDGTPAEIAFAKIAESTRGLVTENFFKTVNINIQNLGMSLNDAIFNSRRGAIIFYPSPLIATSMRILVESVRKGLQVAASSLMSISEYVKNIQKINQRLRDLLADVVSDMRSNMTFLAPLLAGIVVGLGSMITMILNKLQVMFDIGGDAELTGIGNLGDILNIFDLTAMIPPYFLQLAVGIYLIQIVFILTSTLVTVDAGSDKLRNVYETGKNLRISMILYLLTAFFAIIALAILAVVALGGLVT